MKKKLSKIIKGIFLLLLGISFSKNLNAQIADIDSLNAINGVKLNSDISELKEHIYLITGNESVYQRYKFMQRSVLQNIEKGIREGIYEGNIHHTIYGHKATKTTFYFYKGELFKIRWFFSKSRYEDLSKLRDELIKEISKVFGEPRHDIVLDMKIWEGRKNHLQTFLDEREFQVELKDRRFARLTETW